MEFKVNKFEFNFKKVTSYDTTKTNNKINLNNMNEGYEEIDYSDNNPELQLKQTTTIEQNEDKTADTASTSTSSSSSINVASLSAGLTNAAVIRNIFGDIEKIENYNAKMQQIYKQQFEKNIQTFINI